jgi:hypothetical protein
VEGWKSLVSTKRYARSVTLLRSAGSQLCLCAVRAPSVVLKLSGTNGQNEKGKERKVAHPPGFCVLLVLDPSLSWQMNAFHTTNR